MAIRLYVLFFQVVIIFVLVFIQIDLIYLEHTKCGTPPNIPTDGQMTEHFFFPNVIIRVVYHGVASSFFGIGILLVSNLFGSRYFWSVLLIWRELLFSAKGGLAVSKRGLVPPFSSKRGPLPPF